jgi:uncharacterized protein (TIGR03437 family)
MHMKSSLFPRSGVLLAVFASTLCSGLLQAAVLSLSATSANTITCNTSTGPATPVLITVKSGLDLGFPIVVTPGPLPAGLAVSPSTLTMANAAAGTTGVVFTLSAAQGCAGLSAGANTASTFTFMASQSGGAAVADVNTVTTTITVTATTSALSATPSASTISCLLNGSTYTPTPSTITLSVSNTATGGTPFTFTKPTWMTVTTAGPYSVVSTTVASTYTLTPLCSGPVGSVVSGPVTLNDAPAPAVSVNLTMKVVGPATLTATTPAVQTYTKGSGALYYPTWTVTLGGAATGQIYTVNQATLGSWLTASPMSGAYGTANTILFQATGGIDALTAQNAVYTQVVHISVSGYADTTVSIGLLVANPAPTLSFAEGNVRNLTWVQGQGIPTAIITAVSSNSPIQYSTTSSGAIAPIIAAAEASGLAFSQGTIIPVTFPNLPFSEAQPGNVLTGAVTFAWGTTTSTVTFFVSVQAGISTASLGSASPANLPTAATGEQFTVTLYGSGFVPVSDPTLRTNVGIVHNGVITPDPNILSITVTNSSTIVLLIQAPAPSTDPLLPWTGTSVSFGVCNPFGGACTTPTGTLPMVVGAGPTITNVVSASTQAVLTPPTVAPYDILTIWGSNFCTSNGTGCGASGLLYGTLNPATSTYATALSPDGGQRNLTVSFKLHTAAASTYVAAPLLFASNGQINLVVPATAYPAAGTTVDVLVTFGALSSNVFQVTSTLTDPGIFIVDTYGQGAILNPNYTVANGNNPATAGATIVIYATGLGTPTSLSSGNPVTYGPACITPAAYETIAGNGSSVDGVVIQSALLGGDYPPCFGTGNAPSLITVGGQSAAISYTGWVADSIAGLYQSNVTLHAATSPSSPAYFVDAAGTQLTAITSPVQLPIKITSNSVVSQAPNATNLGLSPGVTLWVAPPALSLTNPGAQSVSATSAAFTSAITASHGTAPYTFTVNGSSTGSLANGLAWGIATPTLTFTTSPSSVGVYLITVIATDANGQTGSVTFTLTVADTTTDTSTVTASATAVASSVYGTANPSVTTITPGGGSGSGYLYAVSSAGAIFQVSPAGVVSYTGGTHPGNYLVDITVTDSLGATRDIYFMASVTGLALTATNNLITLTGVANLSSTQALTTFGGQTSAGPETITGLTLIQPDAGKCLMTLGSGTTLTVPSSGCPAGTYSVTVIGTDANPAQGPASASTVTLNLSVHLN